MWLPGISRKNRCTVAYETILYEKLNGVATLTLNRPRALNALNNDLTLALREAVQAAEFDLAVRCVVIRGAGTRAFAAGADIAEFERERGNVEQAREYGILDGVLEKRGQLPQLGKG